MGKEIKLEDVFNDEKRENIKKFIDEIKNPSEPNQALKEAAHEYFKRGQLGFEKASDTERAFLNGAKWQQERSYSEEDMKSFADWIRNGLLNIEYSVDKLDKHLQQWKQFKKK